MDEGIKTVVDFIERTPWLPAPQISEALGVPVKTMEHRLMPLINSLVIILAFRHAGLDPASSISLDSGFRRNDGLNSEAFQEQLATTQEACKMAV